MSRAIDLRLDPKEHADAGLSLQVYTYAPDSESYPSLCETVKLNIGSGIVNATVRLTPDEARVLANQLMQVADTADENRERRTSFEQIQEEMRDADELGGTACYYAHPDVHYVPADQVAEKVRELNAAGAPRFIVLPDPGERQAA